MHLYLRLIIHDLPKCENNFLANRVALLEGHPCIDKIMCRYMLWNFRLGELTSGKSLFGAALAFSCSRYCDHEKPRTFLVGSEVAEADEVDRLPSLYVSSSFRTSFGNLMSTGWDSPFNRRRFFFFLIPWSAAGAAGWGKPSTGLMEEASSWPMLRVCKKVPKQSILVSVIKI